jgi:hypothetical protein
MLSRIGCRMMEHLGRGGIEPCSDASFWPSLPWCWSHARRSPWARRKSSPLIPRARRGAGGHDPGIGDPFQGVELASDPMHEGMLSARIEHHSVERRKHGCRQCDLRRHHRTWGRCRLWRDEQISRRGHRRDDAGSGMPRPGTAAAQPGTVAAHLGAVVFRADPRARRCKHFQRLALVTPKAFPQAQALSSWSRQGLRRHSAVLQQCVSRPARQLESQYCSSGSDCLV